MAEGTNPGRPYRSCFEALAGAYLAFCDEERGTWLAAEPSSLIALGAKALLPLAELVLAEGGREGPGAGLSAGEACLSIWALLDGSLREAVAADRDPAASQNRLTAAARALEYMVGGLAGAGDAQAGGP